MTDSDGSSKKMDNGLCFSAAASKECFVKGNLTEKCNTETKF